MPTSAQTTSPMLNSTSNNPTTWHHQLFQRQALRLQQCISTREGEIKSLTAQVETQQHILTEDMRDLERIELWLKDN